MELKDNTNQEGGRNLLEFRVQLMPKSAFKSNLDFGIYDFRDLAPHNYMSAIALVNELKTKVGGAETDRTPTSQGLYSLKKIKQHLENNLTFSTFEEKTQNLVKTFNVFLEKSKAEQDSQTNDRLLMLQDILDVGSETLGGIFYLLSLFKYSKRIHKEAGNLLEKVDSVATLTDNDKGELKSIKNTLKQLSKLWIRFEFNFVIEVSLTALIEVMLSALYWVLLQWHKGGEIRKKAQIVLEQFLDRVRVFSQHKFIYRDLFESINHEKEAEKDFFERIRKNLDSIFLSLFGSFREVGSEISALKDSRLANFFSVSSN